MEDYQAKEVKFPSFGMFLMAAILGGLIVFGFSSFTRPAEAPLTIGSGTNSANPNGGKNASVNVTSTPALILAANTGRTEAHICNNSTSTLYTAVLPASYAAVTSTVGQPNYLAANTGKAIYPSTCWDLYAHQDPPTGNVWGVTGASTAQTIGTMEFTGQ